MVRLRQHIGGDRVPVQRLLFAVIALGMISLAIIAVFAAIQLAGGAGETVTTDKAEYHPDETAIISGTGYTSGQRLDIVVIRPDLTIVTGAGTNTPGFDTVTATSGAFTYQYILNGIFGLYTVNVYDSVADAGHTTVLATTTFLDDAGPAECNGGPTVGDNEAGDGDPADGDVEVTAPSGEVITGICIKSGSDTFNPGPTTPPPLCDPTTCTTQHSGLITADGTYGIGGCYTVSGIGTNVVTVKAGVGCKAVSHIDFFTEPEKEPPTTTTQASTNATDVVPGTSVTDTATVAGSGPTPTGTVDFFLCQPSEVTGGGCEGSAGTQIGVTKNLSGGSATSDATTNTNAIGKYCWRAEYSGDSFYLPDNHTNSTTECFTTEKQPSTTATQASTNATDVAPGTSVTDTATVSGSGPTPTGTVDFFLCQPSEVTGGGCEGSAGTKIGVTKNLSGGSATSDATTNTNALGKYCWRAEYSGDSFYNAGNHTNATSECFSVKGPPDITSQASTNATDVAPGTSVTDTATLSGSGPTPTGTVDFFLCQPSEVTGGGCEGSAGTQIGATKNLVSGSATSDATTNTNAIGKYCWRAEYSGDSFYLPSSHTNSTSECFTTFEKEDPNITSQASTNATDVAPGTSVTDTATLSGSGPTPTGTVDFFLCQPSEVTGGGCEGSAGTKIGVTKNLSGGSATSDATTNTTTLGKYCWRVEYSGDGSYNAGNHTNATSECFSVKGPPGITSQASTNATDVVPGTSVTDTATLSGTPTPTGTVDFFLCQPGEVTANGGDCSANGTKIGVTKNLSGGTATSDATTNTTAIGKYCWRVEYSGDSFYLSDDHTNDTSECFTTEKQPSSTATQASTNATNVALGTSVTDTATVSGSGPTPTGTVDFFLCQPGDVTGGGCEGSAGTKIGVTKNLSGGTATSDATTNTNTAGKYCWRAEYSGDSFYNPSEHTNDTTECFTTIGKQPPDITSQASTNATNVAPGTSVTDTATLTGTPTPTGTVDFFLCQPGEVTANGGDCSANGTKIGVTKNLSGGTATSDATTNTTAIGKYCWRVEYSGDSFYLSDDHTNSTTECFTTEKQPPDITSQASTNATDVAPGTSVTDTATLSGSGPTPTGTVDFFLCQPSEVTGGGCEGSAGTKIGVTKNLSGGTATSDATTNTNAIGKYCWRAEYSGDGFYLSGNHTNATSECFTVQVTDFTTQASTNANVAPGTSVSDTATLSGTPTPTGTVDFFLCQPSEVSANGGDCSANGTKIGVTKNLVSGSATSDATTNTNTPGKYCWRVEYSGDGFYNPSSHTNSTTECFTVGGVGGIVGHTTISGSPSESAAGSDSSQSYWLFAMTLAAAGAISSVAWYARRWWLKRAV